MLQEQIKSGLDPDAHACRCPAARCAQIVAESGWGTPRLVVMNDRKIAAALPVLLRDAGQGGVGSGIQASLVEVSCMAELGRLCCMTLVDQVGVHAAVIWDGWYL